MALIKCIECGKEISDKAKNCPHCGCPVQTEIQHTNEIKKPDSYITTINGMNVNLDEIWEKSKNISKMIDEVKNRTGIKKKDAQKIVEKYLEDRGKINKKAGTLTGCSVIFVGVLFIMFMMVHEINKGVNDGDPEIAENKVATETSSNETTEATTEISVDELKEVAEEVTWDELYRNPETWRGKYIKITVRVDKYDAQYLGLLDTYYCSVNGQMVFVTECRKVTEPTIASGDTVIVYGKGAGLATMTETQKNILGVKTDKVESKVPSIDMYAAELQ